MNAQPRRYPMDSLLGVFLLLALAMWMATAHWVNIDEPKLEQKTWLHERVIANEAADPYQYKLWFISHAFEHVSDWTGESLEWIFYRNTLLSLLFLVLVHHLWLRRYVGGRAALLGSLLLGALANVLFLIYYHHPYEFWGVGLFCVLLIAIQRGATWWKLALLCLLTGLVWEKHALLPVLWGLRELGRRQPFLPSLGKGLVMLAAAVAVPVFVRLHLGTDRAHIDGDTYMAVQQWGKVWGFQLPYMLPFVAVFLLRFRATPPWVRMLWLYLPVLAAAYVSQSYILHEVRSFWALAPVFTATVACWFEDWSERRGVAQPTHEDGEPEDPAWKDFEESFG